MERKLAAIFSADVKGYSRLMCDDEIATVRTLTAYREVMTALIHAHRGRVVDSPGDNMLVEFASAVDAVQCATEIQYELSACNAELPPDRQMAFRIGINVGDVLTDKGRLYGDGVNIAARLEGLADAGGICLSEAAYTQVKNKLVLGYEYIGEQQVKNIAEPVRVWRVVMDEAAAALAEQGVLRSFDSAQDKRTQHERESALLTRNSSKHGKRGTIHRAWVVVVGLVLIAGAVVTVQYLSRPPLSPQSLILSPKATPAALPLPDKPSVAVLPFTNMSGDPEQEYFSDGMTDTLITDLSKLSGLFVIARNSTFTYKGKPVKVTDVSQELGVRYVVEGSIQKAGDRVRINTQLIDATTGRHVWAERYDRELKDIFALQDELVQKMVTTLKLQLTLAEQGVLVRKSTGNLEAYDSYLRGVSSFWRFTKGANVQARQMFEHAIELDPGYAEAYASLSATHWIEWAVGWNQDPQTLERAFVLVKRAVALDDSLPTAHLVLGAVCLWKKQHERAVAEGGRAIALDPNFADAYMELAHTLTYAGRPEEAIELVQKGMRLNPRHPFSYLWVLGRAYNLAGRYEEALPVLKKVIAHPSDFLPAYGDLAVIYSELGREEEARAAAAEIIRIAPNSSLEFWRQMLPFKDPAVLERTLTALRKAGLK